MAEHTSSQRKSESQKIFEQADNAGRFSGNDTDAQTARHQGEENIRADAQSLGKERDKMGIPTPRQEEMPPSRTTTIKARHKM